MVAILLILSDHSTPSPAKSCHPLSHNEAWQCCQHVKYSFEIQQGVSYAQQKNIPQHEPIISIKEFGHCIKRFWDPATCIVWNVWISRPTTLDLAYAHVCKNAVQIATSWCTLPAASEVNVSIFIHIFFWGSRHKPQRRSQGVCFLSLAEYTLACLSTMFLGYLFRHCFVIFVPLFWDFLSLFLGNFCP